MITITLDGNATTYDDVFAFRVAAGAEGQDPSAYVEYLKVNSTEARDLDTLMIIVEDRIPALPRNKRKAVTDAAKACAKSLAADLRAAGATSDLIALQDFVKSQWIKEWEKLTGPDARQVGFSNGFEDDPDEAPPASDTPPPPKAEKAPKKPKAEKAPKKPKAEKAEKTPRGRQPVRDLQNPPFGFYDHERFGKVPDFYDPDAVRVCKVCGAEGTNSELFGPRVIGDGSYRIHQSQCRSCRRNSAKAAVAKSKAAAAAKAAEKAAS